jgi:hypothetical protein
MNNRQMNLQAAKKAEAFEKLATESPESLAAAGAFVPVILGESALLLSHFSDTEGDIYAYGSHRAASLALAYKKREPGKEKLVRSLLTAAREQIEAQHIEERSPHYLHHLDIRGLTSLVADRPDYAAAMFDRIHQLDPDRLGFSGRYLATLHNESLLLQLTDQRRQAEAGYLKLLDEQRERQGFPSPITARNLATLLEDDQLSAHILRSVDYGRAPHSHTQDSRDKAARLYELKSGALRRMR